MNHCTIDRMDTRKKLFFFQFPHNENSFRHTCQARRTLFEEMFFAVRLYGAINNSKMRRSKKENVDSMIAYVEHWFEIEVAHWVTMSQSHSLLQQ